MEDPLYLHSALETILASLDNLSPLCISPHDLIEAYSSLSNRIRARPTLITHGQSPAALESLQNLSSQVARAIVRDLQLTMMNHLFGPEGVSIPGNSWASGTRLSAGEIQHVRNMMVLRQFALCLLSDILCFKSLATLFSTKDIASMLAEIIKIASSECLQAPNYGKFYTLAIWTLQRQQLPPTITSQFRRDICTIFNDAVRGKGETHHALIAGLKGIKGILESDPDQFLKSLTDLLPSVLAHLISKSPDIRLCAASTVGAYTTARLRSSAPNVHKSVSDAILSFIDVQASMSRQQQLEDSLPKIIAATLHTDNPAHTAEGPVWAISVLGSLIILADQNLFHHSRFLKFVLPSLAKIIIHTHKAIRTLHSFLWMCLVWAFSQIIAHNQGDQHAACNTPEFPDVQERAFRVVKQELRNGIGIALVSALLRCRRSGGQAFTRIHKAIIILKEMVCCENITTCQDGLQLLSQLLEINDIPSGETTSAQETSIPWAAIYNGDLLNAKWKEIDMTIKRMKHSYIQNIQPLSEPEVKGNWAFLLEVWSLGAEKSLLQKSTLPEILLPSWKQLLLVGSRFLHDQVIIPFDSPFPPCSVISAFLQPVVDSSSQLARLTLVDRLWTIANTVFASSSLISSAETLLSSVLNQQFNLDDENVKTAWARLCSNLIPLAPLVCLKLGTLGLDIELTRMLWMVSSRSLQEGPTVSWKDSLMLLALPFGQWNMSEPELAIWTKAMDITATNARAAGVPPTSAIEDILWLLKVDNKYQGFLQHTLAVLAIMSHVDLADQPTLPSQSLSAIDQILYSLYPPSQASLPIILQFLSILRRMINDVPINHLSQLLVVLRRSLCLWIEDKSETLSDVEYNDFVIALYCDGLVRLRACGPSADILHDLSEFLASSFVRIPSPALGPLAFQSYWLMTFGTGELSNIYPECIKQCLRAIDDAYGSNLAQGLSTESESETTPGTVILDSEDSPTNPQLCRASHWLPISPGHMPEGASDIDYPRLLPIAVARTPVTPIRRTSTKGISATNALLSLQQYSSQTDEEGSYASFIGFRDHSVPISSDEARRSAQPAPPDSYRDRDATPNSIHSRKRSVSPQDWSNRKRRCRSTSSHSGSVESGASKASGSQVSSAHKDIMPVTAGPGLQLSVGQRLVFDGILLPSLPDVLNHKQHQSSLIESHGQDNHRESPVIQ